MGSEKSVQTDFSVFLGCLCRGDSGKVLCSTAGKVGLRNAWYCKQWLQGPDSLTRSQDMMSSQRCTLLCRPMLQGWAEGSI